MVMERLMLEETMEKNQGCVSGNFSQVQGFAHAHNESARFDEEGQAGLGGVCVYACMCGVGIGMGVGVGVSGWRCVGRGAAVVVAVAVAVVVAIS